MTDLDFLDRANITVIKGEPKAIDKTRKLIKLKGSREVTEFDKMLVAWGAHKKRLNKDYSNVFYLEDRYSHAKAHNEIIKAEKIVVLGSSIEAYQTASSVREYLNSIGYQKTKVILVHEANSEIFENMGGEVNACLQKMLLDQGVNIIDKVKITKIAGDYKVEKLHFRKKDPKTDQN